VLREVMGDAAEFVDALDPHAIAAAVIGLIENPQRRRLLIAAGTALSARLTVEACVRRHIEVYEAVVAPMRAPAAISR
jgi:glycosyltransferase involved in cell wall biosynthesis